MDFIIDAIVEWLKGLLVDGIMGNLDGLFDNVNQSVGEIATQVGTTPADWNAGVFSMIRQISETAILPIAGVILTFVMTYELIQMLIERNRTHGAELFPLPLCGGLSRSVDLSLCCHLCGADPEYRHRRRPHRGDLGLCGIYGAAVFYLIQNRQSCKIHLRLPLRDFGP